MINVQDLPPLEFSWWDDPFLCSLNQTFQICLNKLIQFNYWTTCILILRNIKIKKNKAYSINKKKTRRVQAWEIVKRNNRLHFIPNWGISQRSELFAIAPYLQRNVHPYIGNQIDYSFWRFLMSATPFSWIDASAIGQCEIGQLIAIANYGCNWLLP